MIAEKELLEAIKECESEPITASKAGKLADFYIIYDRLFGDPVNSAKYSHNAGIPEKIIDVDGGSEFLMAINGMNAEKVWLIIDELMTTIKIINPRLYDGVFRRLE